MDDTNPLPSDLKGCHRLLMAAYQQSKQLEQQTAEAQSRVSASEQQVAELARVLDETAASYQELQQEHAATLDELATYKRWVFGRRKERFTEAEGQGHLFELAPSSDSDPKDSVTLQNEVEINGHRRRRQRRQIDWDKLPQVVHRHDLEESEKQCTGCGRQMDQIGEDITRELEFQQPKLEAHIHVRPKYACRCCKDGVSSASVPARPIPGGIAGPGLISEVIVSKFGDHLPLYRLEDILTRCGVYLARSTLCDWVKATAELLRPLYDLQRQRVVQSSVMWTDDTKVTVLGGNKGSFQGYFWAYIGNDEQPYSVYDFTTSRSRDGPLRFLEGFSGYLHADAYAGYDAMFSDVGSNVAEVACWAHARRKFFDAVGNYPREAHQVLEW
jgi:transposase